MLLDYHKGYTEAALKSLTLSADIKKQIVTGCTANDLCELTNLIEPFIASHNVSTRARVATEALQTRKAIRLPSVFALYETHFGDLASMHGMTKDKGEPAIVTKTVLEHWFTFLNQVALGKLSIKPNADIGDDNAPISYLFGTDSQIEYDQIFASDNLTEIKSRAVGMMCHLIQDLFTISHCKRDSSKKIEKFYHYPSQDSKKHKDADVSIHIPNDELIQHCRTCIERISLKKPYNYLSILELTAHPQGSDGGEFA